MQRLKENWHLVMCLFILLSVTMGRVVYSLRSGFILPDEALSYTITPTFLERDKLLFVYDRHLLFQLMILGLSMLFQVDNVWKFMTVFPFVSFLFSFGTVFLIWRITRNKYLTIASVLTISILTGTATILSEVPSLFFVTLGIYFIVRKQMFYGMLSLSIAIWFREPYTIFLIGNFVLNREKWKELLLGALPAGTPIFFRIGRELFPNIPTLITLPTTSEPLTVSPIEVSIGRSRIIERILFVPYNSIVGLIFSLTPLLALLVIYTLFKQRNQRTILWWNGLFAIGSLLLLNFIILRDLFYVVSSTRYSALIRFASISFPAVIMLKLNRKMFLVFLLLLLAIAPIGLYAIQSNLSIETVNRFSLDYEAPWLKLARHIQNENGSVLVYGEPIVRAKLFLPKDVTISFPPRDESEFNATIKDVELVYFYGEKHGNHERTLQDNFSWYFDLIKNRRNVSEVWNNLESYLLQWNR